ncbi:MAG: GntR family transcriptional regulator [Spirochaetia bacterium]|nr:GntR family transcriptional regulator [Spirochaetia bacterium]
MEKLQYEDLPLKVYKALKDMILRGELKSGQKLQQEKLAEQLGVSRTPLLTAFSKLEREMLIEILPRKGAYVRHFSKKELLDIYDIRVRMEPLGARKAAENATKEHIEELRSRLEEFRAASEKDDIGHITEADYKIHMEIMKTSGNHFLYQMASSFNIIVIANLEGFPKDYHVSIDEHEHLFDAIKSGDGDTAEKAMHSHLSSSREIIANSFA